ncbi:MAG: SRPBCC family protein [Culicoidibacterales bacterium]
MKKTKTVIIDKPIETVFAFLDGSEENLKKMDDKIQFNKVIIETPNKIGSKYLQGYKEGTKVMEYEIEVIDYIDKPDFKLFKFHFTLGKSFAITVAYVLDSVDENQTKVAYTVENKPLTFIMKILFKFMGDGDKMVDKHLTKLKELIEA